MSITFSQLNTEQSGRIRNPFLANAQTSTQESSLLVRKNILELRSDKTLRLKFSDVPLDEMCIEEVYKQIIEILLHFTKHGLV